MEDDMLTDSQSLESATVNRLVYKILVVRAQHLQMLSSSICIFYSGERWGKNKAIELLKFVQLIRKKSWCAPTLPKGTDTFIFTWFLYLIFLLRYQEHMS